jgi:DNA-binding transcriptional LysR family regulator
MRVPDIDLDLVRCFVTVVESDGFTQASKRLHLTQSATTMKIKRLEELLGQRLFVKTVPPLELTLEGEIVLGYAFRLLELNRDMVMRVSRPNAMTTIRLGVISHFGYHHLPLWLSTFKKACPQIRVVMDMGMTDELLKSLDEDHFDLVIAAAGYTGMAQYKSAPRLNEQHLQKEKLFWVQADDSKIDTKKDPVPLVMFGRECRFRPLCLDALQRAGRTWEIVYDGGSIHAIQSAVEADLGLSVLTGISLKPGIEIVGKKAGLPPLPPCNLALYYRENLTVPAVRKLADFIVEQVTQLENESRELRSAPRAMDRKLRPWPRVIKETNHERVS